MGFLISYELRKPHAFADPDHRFSDASFLCPVCAHPLLGEAGASAALCGHVLLAVDRSGAIRCRDARVRDLLLDAQNAARQQGGDPMEGLRKRLGSNVVFFELQDRRPGSMEPEVFTFVVDIATSIRRADSAFDLH